MRIISTFKDYYDIAMRYGQDQELIYHRKAIYIKNPISTKPAIAGARAGNKIVCGHRDKETCWHRHDPLSCESYVIGFCGKVYGCLKLTTDLGTVLKPHKAQTAYCYDIESADKFVKKHFKKKHIESYHNVQKETFRWSYSRHNHIGASHYEFKRYFDKRKEERDKYKDFFIENHTPLFVVRGNGVFLNEQLKEYEFYKVMDPYTAYQELQMYWGSMAVPIKPIPKISDADMLQAKGFDPKFSFRAEPGGKKRKRKKK
ncbi:MAG: hypothetical protein ACTSYO_05750 [Candidatus Ranarchaeia archaeon]